MDKYQKQLEELGKEFEKRYEQSLKEADSNGRMKKLIRDTMAGVRQAVTLLGIMCYSGFTSTVLPRLIPRGNYFSLSPFEGGGLIISICQRAGKQWRYWSLGASLVKQIHLTVVSGIILQGELIFSKVL